MAKSQLITAVVMALLPSAGWTQISSQASNPEIVSSPISPDAITVTALRAPEFIYQTGQSVTIIDPQSLQSRQTSALSDILATTPGVTVARTGGIGAVTSVFIRGASSEHTLVVIDGVRVNDPSTPAGSYDFGNLLAGNIARVDVLRGADSVPWGSAAIGGVVNITTFAPTSQFSGSVSAEGGSYDTKSVTGHVSDTFGPIGLSLGGGWFDTGGISAFAQSEGGKEADASTQHYLNARAVVRLSGGLSVDLRGRYSRGKVNIDGFPPPSFTFGDTPEYNTSRELGGSAGLTGKLLDGRFISHLTYSISNTHRAGYDPSQPAAFRLEYAYKGEAQRLEYQGDFKFNEAARLVFGVEGERSSLNDSFARYRTGYEGVYGQMIATPVAALTLTAGVRYDYHRVYDGHTTLSANAAWRPTQLTILRASYAEGFKAPALSQIYGDGGVFTAKNLNLKPETATSYEIGIEQSALGRTLRASMTYYNRHTHDLIQYAFAPSSACSSGFCGINQNVARANAEGLEAAVTIAPVPAFTASFNFTHGKSYDATSGLRLLRRPDDSIALNADWDAGRLKLGGTLQMVGSSFDTDSNTFSRVRIPSHVLAGARATLPIGAHLELYSRIDNLFDAQYQAVRHYGTLGRAGYIGVRVKS